MAFTRVQLDAIESAIASGARTVAYEGKNVTYSSLDEMLRVRSMIRRELGLAPARGSTVLVAHDRGFDRGSQRSSE